MMLVYILCKNKPIAVIGESDLIITKDEIIVPYSVMHSPLPAAINVFIDNEELDGGCCFLATGENAGIVISLKMLGKKAVPKIDKNSRIFLSYEYEINHASLGKEANILEEANSMIKNNSHGTLHSNTLVYNEMAVIANLTFSKQELGDGIMNASKVVKTLRAAELIRSKNGDRDSSRIDVGLARVLEILKYNDTNNIVHSELAKSLLNTSKLHKE